MKKWLIFLAGLSLLASCNRQTAGNRPVIAYVDRLLSDTLCVPFQRLSSHDTSAVTHPLVILGDPQDVALVTEAFLTCDRYDNISGRTRPDALPDFSGEMIAPLLDRANAPYADYVTLDRADLLREVTVRMFLSAIDTASLPRPYDIGKKVHKDPAKVVLLASTVLSAYGYESIDTLRTIARSTLPVFSALHAMVEDAAALRKGTKNILVWTSEANDRTGVYDILPGLLDEGDACVVYHPLPDSVFTLSVRDRFLQLLDRYLSEYGTRRVSTVFLDDPEVDPAALEAVLRELLQSDDDRLSVYRSLLEPDCVCLTPALSLTRLCFGWMRRDNAFSHRIAYPRLTGFFTAPMRGLPDEAYDVSGEFSYPYKYMRPENQAEDPFVTVQLQARYIPDPLLRFMKDRTPKLYAAYVR